MHLSILDLLSVAIHVFMSANGVITRQISGGGVYEHYYH